VVYDTMIDVKNTDLKLKPGMTANVAITVASRSGVLKVPNGALRARVPESLLPPKPAADGKPGPVVAAKPLSDEERRKQMQDLMRDAGFVRGNGPPSAEVIARVQELAKERGIELPAGRFGGGGGGDSSAPVTRTLYVLVGAEAATAHPEAVTVRLGITDGMATEASEGLKEGDTVITAVVVPGAKPGAPATNPFGGQRRGF
jgi:HlyD family secretion protein